MDFVRSYFFPNATLTSWKFFDHFCHHLGLLSLCCCTNPKMMTKMAKKCSTDQSCIWKEVTSYKIGILVVRQLLGSCQAVVKQSLGNNQAVIRQSFHLLHSLLDFSSLFKSLHGKNFMIKIHSKQEINSQKLTLWRAKKH